MIIHLGVVDIPYTNPAETKANGGRRSGTQTTGDVAEWLEDKYGVMQHYVDYDRKNIDDAVSSSLLGAFETFAQSGRMPKNPYNKALSTIQKNFKTFLREGTIETLGVGGVPTKAALDGVNHRKKTGFNKNKKRRPSFIDTGLYQKSFKAWI